MFSEQCITIITGLLEGGGLAIFLWFLIRGLKQKVAALNNTIDAQQKTL